MTDAEARLGGRLPLLDPETLNGASRELYETLRGTLIPWADRNGFTIPAPVAREEASDGSDDHD